ncbi:Glucose-6-phosphate 1-dehydrogenase [Buchnera aphidicola (Cinara pseudotaxifoliae)]|uniref:Glucose-6-phosphate 1-dehydrogenase n=1 Tax=Buchnera aphidicola (Cinara pseudotaxifoliae) TaxID=655384 RepID=A0A451DH47_9GAMM|nr:glucose-6-phosphate dehydrogenase [Buchnera aphidicola]VFP85932.1 Glucose-6-phosphate 1-dehydrogenase [Buchnera aphidicola (Cinara pseudotaxifoliae)]
MLLKKNYDLIIFGTTGDLAQRKLFPALYQLEKQKYLVSDMKIIGISRTIYTKEEYLQIIYNSLKKFLNENIKLSVWKSFKKRFTSVTMDINKIQDFIKLTPYFKKKNSTLINYLAVSSDMFEKIFKGLSSIKFNKSNSKIVVEKPIGKSLSTFLIIEKSIKKYFSKKKIFRIDHYLGKKTILNLIELKFFNPIFNSYLNKHYIDHVQITLSESIGIENRWDYFDNTGQIIDMVQNHMLQIISIFAMKTPESFNQKNICDEKIKILKSLRKINKNNIHNYVSLGQYSSNNINNHIVKAYINEKKAKKNSSTETFVAMKLYIDTKQWRNVPFYIRTGKRLFKKSSKIVVFFKKKHNILFKNKYIHSTLNRMTINLQPIFKKNPKKKIKISQFNSNKTFKKNKFYSNEKLFFLKNKILEEYERLFIEIIQDRQFLFVQQKEIIYAWKWIDPIIQAYKSHPMLLQYYNSGTWGPQSAFNLIQKDKKKWDNN